MFLLVILFFHCFTFIIVALACHYSYLPQSILYPNLLALTMSKGTKLEEKIRFERMDGSSPPLRFKLSAIDHSATSPKKNKTR